MYLLLRVMNHVDISDISSFSTTGTRNSAMLNLPSSSAALCRDASLSRIFLKVISSNVFT